MPAFRTERVELAEDLTRRHAQAVQGARGWSVAGDNSGQAAAEDWWKVQLDSGARIDVRRAEVTVLPVALSWEKAAASAGIAPAPGRRRRL